MFINTVHLFGETRCFFSSSEATRVDGDEPRDFFSNFDGNQPFSGGIETLAKGRFHVVRENTGSNSRGWTTTFSIHSFSKRREVSETSSAAKVLIFLFEKQLSEYFEFQPI